MKDVPAWEDPRAEKVAAQWAAAGAKGAAVKSSRGRPAIAIGGLGTVAVTRHGNMWQARARTRTGGGELIRISCRALTDEGAREGLVLRARRASLKVTELGQDTPLTLLLELWLKEKRRSGKAKERSITVYERHLGYLSAAAGAIAIGELLDLVWRERSLAAAHKCMSILREAFALAVRREALTHTPMTSVDPLPTVRGPRTALTVEQVHALRAAIVRREEYIRSRFGRDALLLRLLVEVLLASGLRVSEGPALQHRDVDLDAGTISVSRTLIVAPGGAVVEDGLKRDGQERVIGLPGFGVAALREARTLCTTVHARVQEQPAIQSAAGTPVLPYNLGRALRSLHNDSALIEALATTGLKPADVTPHTLRRTTARLLAKHDGRAQAAQELLGHANEATTRQSYISGAYRKVSGAAPTLQALLGGEAKG